VTAEALNDAAGLLRRARRVAVLTGAGVSAESGIPTFRDALTGLWASYDPEELATPEGFARQPQLVWDWYAERRARVGSATPNAGHLALVEIERRVEHFTLVTQNVDGLHQAAGSRRVIELHGNIRRVRCSAEGTVVAQWDAAGERPPRCPDCGAMLRPDVVWFGELLPPTALQDAWAAARSCDLFLSVGTSNLVEPAASLPWTAHRRGAAVVVVNTSDEGQRRGARIHCLLGPAGGVLPALVDAAWA
jgi:NAD-dependent deacetylase